MNMWMCLVPYTAYFKCTTNASFFPIFKTEKRATGNKRTVVNYSRKASALMFLAY